MNLYERQNNKSKHKEGKLNRLNNIVCSAYAYHVKNKNAPLQRKKTISAVGSSARFNLIKKLTKIRGITAVPFIHNLCRFPDTNQKIEYIKGGNQLSKKRIMQMALKYGKKFKTLSFYREQELKLKLYGVNTELEKAKRKAWKYYTHKINAEEKNARLI